MSAAMRCGKFASIVCVAHTLQRVIHDVIFKDTTIMNIIKKCRKILGHFKRREQASRYLAKYQETCDLPKHVLIQDVETRWNSTYLILERLLEQKIAINLYMAEPGGVQVPTADEWMQMDNCMTVLKCFYQATLDISADNSAISIIIPLIAMLNSKMTIKDQESDNVKLHKSQLCEAVNRRFAYVKNTPHLLIATMIDPRFKTKYLTSDEAEKAKIEIIAFLRQIASNNNKASPMDVDVDEPTTSHSTLEQTSRNASPKNSNNLWDMHDKLSVINEIDLEFKDNEPSFEDHLKKYLKEPILLRGADIYEYWASCPYIYLRPVAIKYLSAPPTSVPSEQLFSSASQIYADR